MQDNEKSAAPVGDIQAGQIALSEKVALVTGGGRGIGATISLVLAQAGADVVINYSTSQEESKRIERQPQKAYSPQQATGNLRLFALRDRPSSYEVFSRNPAASCRE